MLNNNIRLNNNMINKANAAYDKHVQAVAELEELGFELVQNLDDLFENTKEENVAPIVINKGHIVEVQTIKEVYITDDKRVQELQDEVESLYQEIRRHIGRINQLSAELQTKDEIIAALKNGAEMKKLTKDADHETDNSTGCDAIEKPETKKGGDAMSTPKEQPKRNPLLDKIKKAKEWTVEEAIESAKEDIARKAEEKEAAKSKLPEYTLEYDQITFDKSIDSRTMFGIRGQITIGDKTHLFEATNNHHMPIVWGCYDEEFIRLTKEIIMNEVERFTFMNERENNAANYAHINDDEYPLVVWRLTDDNGNVKYHGYACTKQYNYILTWDKAKFNYVGRKLVKNAFSSAPNMWKKLTNESLADKFRAVCASTWPEDFTNDDNDPEPTKDKKQHRVTNEQHQTTNDKVFRITKEQHQSTEDKISNMVHERHQRAKENRIQRPNEIIWDTPIDDFGFTKDSNNTNDDVIDLTADADDLDF